VLELRDSALDISDFEHLLSIVAEGNTPLDVGRVVSKLCVILEGGEDLLEIFLVFGNDFSIKLCRVDSLELEGQLCEILEIKFDIDIGCSGVVSQQRDK